MLVLHWQYHKRYVCVWVCVTCVCVVAMTECASYLRQLQLALTFRDWRNGGFASARATYAYMRAGQGWQGALKRLQNWTELHPHHHHPHPISPPFSWTLEASIPPSTLALIITKDRMHKTWRTLRQRQPRLPFSLYTEPGNNTWAPLACDSDDTHAVFFVLPYFFVILFLFLCVSELCGVITALALFICVCEIYFV